MTHIGLAFASGLPIIIADSTYNPVSVDGVLEQTSNPLNSKIIMTAPYFGSGTKYTYLHTCIHISLYMNMYIHTNIYTFIYIYTYKYM
jgi:hypothetical protein